MAKLQKQTAVVTLKGLNQKIPGTIGAPGEMELAENLICKRGAVQQGQFEFVRRNGMTTIATGANNTGARMVSYNGGLLMVSQGDVQVYSPEQKSFAQQAIYPAAYFPAQVEVNSIVTPTPQAAGAVSPTQSSLDIAMVANTACYTWIDQSGVVNFSIFDTSVKTQLSVGTLNASGGTNAKTVSLGTTFYVFWKEANNIKGATILSGAPYTTTASVNVIAAAAAFAGTDYDVTAGFDGTHIAIMYRNNTPNHVRALLSTAFAVTTSVTDVVTANQPDVGMCWFTQRVPTSGSLYYGTVNAANGSKLQTINNATLAITATVTVAGLTSGVNFTGFLDGSGNPYLLRSVAGASPPLNFVGDGSTFGGPFTGLFSYALASRAFYLNGRATVLGVYNSPTAAAAPQDVYALIDYASGYPRLTTLARILPGRADRQTSLHLSSVVADASGALHMVGQAANNAQTSAGAIGIQYTPMDIKVAFMPATLGAPISMGGVALIPGGQLYEFDGVVSTLVSGQAVSGIHEHGFNVAPEPPTLVEGAAASGNIAPGTRSYVSVYQWRDRSGQIATSAPSTPVAITTVNVNSSVAVTTRTYASSTSREFVQIAIYRTPNNGDGSQYLGVTPPLFNGDWVGGAGSSIFTDTASEATLSSGIPLIPSSAGGELENAPAPAMHAICEHKNRAFGIMSESPHRIIFSKEYAPGTSIGFFDGFIINTPESTGPIYALASFDGHLIAIKRDCIYAIDGDFPDATGGGPQIPLPSFLPTGVGTTAPRSVAVTSHGVMFHSITKGFWLLNRSLQATYIGAQVETQANTGSVVISGACVMSDKTQVRWTSEGGTSFVLDTYFLEQGQPIWTTFTGQPCVHSIVHMGRWYQLTATGDLKVENAIWADGSQPGETGTFTRGADYFGKLIVSDINFGGILGLARIWRGQLLGEWKAAHKLKITISDNHRTVAGQNFTFDATTDPDPYMLEFRPTVQKRTSLDVTIEETTTGAQQTQGAAWTALAFSVGVKPGVSRLPQTKTMVGS